MSTWCKISLSTIVVILYFTFGGLVTYNMHRSCNSLPYTPYLEDQWQSPLHNLP